MPNVSAYTATPWVIGYDHQFLCAPPLPTRAGGEAEHTMATYFPRIPTTLPWSMEFLLYVKSPLYGLVTMRRYASCLNLDLSICLRGTLLRVKLQRFISQANHKNQGSTIFGRSALRAINFGHP